MNLIIFRNNLKLKKYITIVKNNRQKLIHVSNNFTVSLIHITIFS